MRTGGPSRGEAAHNAGNLRYNARIAWLGEDAPPQDDRGYCRFKDDFYGLRALAMDLYHKWARGLRTVEQIISVYAPPSENDTDSYIADVCERLAVKPDTLLDFSRIGNLVAMVRAVIKHEQGRIIYAPDLIVKAVGAAIPQLTETQQ